MKKKGASYEKKKKYTNHMIYANCVVCLWLTKDIKSETWFSCYLLYT